MVVLSFVTDLTLTIVHFRTRNKNESGLCRSLVRRHSYKIFQDIEIWFVCTFFFFVFYNIRYNGNTSETFAPPREFFFARLHAFIFPVSVDWINGAVILLCGVQKFGSGVHVKVTAWNYRSPLNTSRVIVLVKRITVTGKYVVDRHYSIS